MKSVIVGTAGHIDHGKTALVKALTGIDADRLEEEKRRGITIDIGFAHLDMPAPTGDLLRLGFVDVPGHERFVRNMLAGVGGIDIVLLVVAADESVKPQTREHFDICRLLSIQRGITVLNKADLVDRETLDVARLEVEEFLRGSFLDPARAPIIPVSAKTGQGIAELKRAMAQIAAEVPAKDSSALFRLPIDRVFVMKGFGTVVTGTLISGAVRKDEELQVYPGGRRLRVRGLQVHNQAAEQAVAGQRTALNLAGVSTEDLGRGMTLAPPEIFQPTKRVDVQLALLPSAKLLRDRARVHLHAFTAETIAEVVLYEGKEIKPGQSALAQLRMNEPMLLLPGDRFILRQFSPVVTIGGGVVIDAAPLKLDRRNREFHLAMLNTLAHGTPEHVLTTRVSRRGISGLSRSEVLAETGWTAQRLEAVIREKEISAQQLASEGARLAVQPPPSGPGAIGSISPMRVLHFAGRLVASSAFTAAQNDIRAIVDQFHKANPLVAGIAKEELREKLGAPSEIFTALLDDLLRQKKLEVSGEQVHAAGHGIVMKGEEAESKRTIEQAFASAGLKVPALKEVLAGLKVDRARAQQIMTLLLREKVLVKVSEDLVFHRDALDALRRRVQQYKAQSPKIDVAKFKDLTGVSRKYAIPLLEYLDRERVTRRVGDERVIL